MNLLQVYSLSEMEDGYVVALPKYHERRVPTIDDIEIFDYVKQKAHLITSNRHFTVWYDGGDYILNVSEVLDDRELAILIGKSRKQKVIWCNQTGESIVLDNTITLQI
jgi:hypothetical protein